MFNLIGVNANTDIPITLEVLFLVMFFLANGFGEGTSITASVNPV